MLFSKNLSLSLSLFLSQMFLYIYNNLIAFTLINILRGQYIRFIDKN